MIKGLQGATAVIAGQELYTAEVFDACPELRLVVRLRGEQPPQLLNPEFWDAQRAG